MDSGDLALGLSYGPAPENADAVWAWLDKYNRQFSHYINGSFVPGSSGKHFKTYDPSTGTLLGNIALGNKTDIDLAVSAARAAQDPWQKCNGHTRARYLYAISRSIQKHSRLFAVLESLDNGKPIRETRDLDIPLVARHFLYHAGAAQLMDKELPTSRAIGVCGQIIPWNFPLLMLSWKIAPAIAMGNTVILKPAKYTPLTALLFAEIINETGLPPGVVNIVTGDASTGECLVRHQDVDKIAFTGSTEVGRRIRRITAGTGKSLTLELGGKSPFIVFDDADIDSAIEGLVDAIWLNQGQVCCAGSRLLVQESIHNTFHNKIMERMQNLRIGNPLDKCIDVGAIIDPIQLNRITNLVGTAKCDGGTVYQSSAYAMPALGCYYPPTLITGLSQSSSLMREEIFGPVLVSATFRTPDEAVELANNTRYGLAASVWSENINLALEIAPRLACGVVWINSTNLFDAAAGFGGRKESGFGREGGWEGLDAYTVQARDEITHMNDSELTVPRTQSSEVISIGIDRTAKMYIGGKQTRPDGGYSIPVKTPCNKIIGYVSKGNRKDIRNAVEAASAAHAWSRTSGHLRSQILYYLAENLELRKHEFIAHIELQTGCSRNLAEEEFNMSVNRLFTYAAWADKYDSSVHNVPIHGIVLAMREPVGIVGALCPERHPLLGCISLIAPLIALGNRCIIVPSQTAPLSAIDLYQVIETSDVPAGVVNIVTGIHKEIGKTLAEHDNVDAVWSFGDQSLAKTVEYGASGNLKRTWVNYGKERKWLDKKSGEGHEFLKMSSDIKNIWIPYGE